MAIRRQLNAEQEIVEAFAQCGQITEYLVTVVPRRFWQQPSPTGHGRTIAAMVAHIHGVRKTFAKMGGAPVPPSLDRNSVTPAQARRALRQTNAALGRCSATPFSAATRASKVCRAGRST